MQATKLCKLHQQSVGLISRDQYRMAKAALDLPASSLAKEAGVHRNTLVRAEDGSASDMTLRQLREFFESRGVQFISTEDGFHGVLYRGPDLPQTE